MIVVCYRLHSKIIGGSFMRSDATSMSSKYAAQR